MDSLEDQQEFESLWRMFKACYPSDAEGWKAYNQQFEDYIPKGTTQVIKKDESIEWKDPHYNRAMLFNDVFARNAFITIQKRKGVFTRN
jgi:hypothetical protein